MKNTGKDVCRRIWRDIMAGIWMENNRVCVTGRVLSGFTRCFQAYGEQFYRLDIGASRASGYMDTIPLTISGKLVDAGKDYTGRIVSVSGQFRSYNQHEGDRGRLVLSVFVQGIEFLEGDGGDCGGNNRIVLDGFLCKEPVYRKTPKGRGITDILLAVNRMYGKSDYIPCIVWGRDAVLAARLEVGSALRVSGRIQSREYKKRLSETEEETRVAYEVSVSTLETEAGMQGI